MLNMVDGFLLAGGISHHVESVYHHPLHDLRNKLDMALCEVTFMEKPVAEHHMASLSLSTFQDICKFAEDHYHKLKDTSKWPPAQQAQDSKAIATPFTSLMNNVLGNLTQPQFLMLMQAGFASGGHKGACHKCGKGHWAN